MPPDPARPSPGYAADIPDDYDRWFGKPGITGATVDALAALAGRGPVLELGVGTGRVALPLRARGLAVHGVEGSEAMLRRLRAKPGGEGIPVTVGDFAEVPVDGNFSLVYLAGGTFAELPDQAAQVRCFRNAAARLAPGGLFVLDAHVPEALAAAGTEIVAEGRTSWCCATAGSTPRRSATTRTTSSTKADAPGSCASRSATRDTGSWT